MSELERQLTAALKRLSAQYETEQRRHSGAGRSLAGACRAAKRGVRDLAAARRAAERGERSLADANRAARRASDTLGRVLRDARRDLVMMVAVMSRRSRDRDPGRDHGPSR